jgi:hypothetical protein
MESTLFIAPLTTLASIGIGYVLGWLACQRSVRFQRWHGGRLPIRPASGKERR